MAEEDEIDDKSHHQGEKDNEPYDYSQVDPLTAIGFHAEQNSIYFINPPKELSTYPMYIENPEKHEKNIGTFISYTLNGTDITEKMSRRYSDFFALYEKLLQRWPGVYIPRIPPKLITKNTSRKRTKRRMRLLNRFCLNLSNIDYLYACEETSLFRGNTQDVANLINKLPEFNLDEILHRMKDAFPEYNENYDILLGKPKIIDFDNFLKKYIKTIELFQKTVESAVEKREQEKKKYVELINGFVEYEKNSIVTYTDDNTNNLIFNNPSYSELAGKVKELEKKMINPFTAFKDWLEEEILDAEGMLIAIKGINEFIEKEEKLRQKLETNETDLKRVESGGSSIKTFFQRKDSVVAKILKEKEDTNTKLKNMELLVKILADNMEKQITKFKEEKTQTYYKYLKIFAILQKESNKVIREIWDLVKNSLNEIAPDAPQANEEYKAEPISKEEANIEQMDAEQIDED